MKSTRGNASCLSATIALVTVLMAFSAGAEGVKYAGAGGKLGFVASKNIGAGVGLGGQVLVRMDLGRVGALDLYPNFEMWYGVDEKNIIYYRQELGVFEAALNFDCRYLFPLPDYVKVRPFVGAGIAPLIYHEEWDPGPDQTRGSASFNIFCGTDLPIGPTQLGFLEVRGKFSGGYPALKLSFGILFKP